MLLIDIRSTNASAAEFILYRLKLYLAGRHHHHQDMVRDARRTTAGRCAGHAIASIDAAPRAGHGGVARRIPTLASSRT